MKEILLNIIDFYRYKIESDKCSQKDMAEVFGVVSKGISNEASIKDIAKFYGQSESNVRNVIHRKSIIKPNRKVVYDFNSFASKAPSTWNNVRQGWTNGTKVSS